MNREQEALSLKNFYQKNLQLLMSSPGFITDHLCFAIEQICTELESKGFYVRLFEIIFPNNEPLVLNLILTDIIPPDYSFRNISFFTKKIIDLSKASVNLIITRIRFEEGNDEVLLGVTEKPGEKTCAFDFKETGIIDNGLESYIGTNTGTGIQS